MEEYENNCNENLVYCLDKINILISKVNKYNKTIKLVRKNSNLLKIKVSTGEDIVSEELEDIKNLYSNLIENSYNNGYEIDRVKEKLDSKIYDLESMIDSLIDSIEKSQNEEIYKKAIQCIYVAKWQNKQREIEYLDYKDTFFSKISGEAKFRKLSIEKKTLEGNLIKKEYAKEVRNYSGQNVREVAIMLKNATDSSFELSEFKDKIISIFMLDDLADNKNLGLSWRPANLLPHGFFEKMKYYKLLNKNTEQEIENLKQKLEENVEKNNVKEDILNNIDSYKEINVQIKDLIDNIKIAV